MVTMPDKLLFNLAKNEKKTKSYKEVHRYRIIAVFRHDFWSSSIFNMELTVPW